MIDNKKQENIEPDSEIKNPEDTQEKLKRIISGNPMIYTHINRE